MKTVIHRIVKTNIEKLRDRKVQAKKRPVAVAEAQSEFFWKALEVVLGASLGLVLNPLLNVTAEHQEWKWFIVLLALWGLNLALAYVNVRRAITLYYRWQDALWQNR